MKLPWSREDSSTGLFGKPDQESNDNDGQKCPGLGKILEKILREDKPEILDLGPFCGATAVYLADRIFILSTSPGTILKTVQVPAPDRPSRVMRRETAFQETVYEIGEMLDTLEEGKD